MLIERMNTNLLTTNSNIQYALSTIELNITNKKNKMNKILIAALVVVIFIAAFLVIKTM